MPYALARYGERERGWREERKNESLSLSHRLLCVSNPPPLVFSLPAPPTPLPRILAPLTILPPSPLSSVPVSLAQMATKYVHNLKQKAPKQEVKQRSKKGKRFWVRGMANKYVYSV